MNMDYFRSTFRLISGSEKPLYQQLYDYFKRLILTGILKEGDQMLPEIAICEELHLSRSTVRKAMDMLIEDGLIERQRGKGTHVMSRQLKRQMNYLYNFTENIQSIGAEPSSIVLEAKVLEADMVPETVRANLGTVSSEGRIFMLRRIRCADQEPMLIEDTYVLYLLCPGIEQIDFSSNSLYEKLKNQYFLHIHHAMETIEAIIIGKEDQKILKCEKTTAGFRIQRVSYLDTGLPFEYTSSVTRSDKCVFQMELYNKGASAVPVEVSRTAVL